jgi:hypothetical protein
MEQKINPFNQVLISQTRNGFVVTFKGEEGEGELKEFYAVYEEGDSEDKGQYPGSSRAENENLKKLFYDLKEYFGFYWSKHSETNLEINVVDTDAD